jgi:hypothetical protein
MQRRLHGGGVWRRRLTAPLFFVLSPPRPILWFLVVRVANQPHRPHHLLEPRPHLFDVGPLRLDVSWPPAAVALARFEHCQRRLGIHQPRRLRIGFRLQRSLRFPEQFRPDLDRAAGQRLVDIGAELLVLAQPLMDGRIGHARRPARALDVAARRQMIEELPPPRDGEAPALGVRLQRPRAARF